MRYFICHGLNVKIMSRLKFGPNFMEMTMGAAKSEMYKLFTVEGRMADFCFTHCFH